MVLISVSYWFYQILLGIFPLFTFFKLYNGDYLFLECMSEIALKISVACFLSQHVACMNPCELGFMTLTHDFYFFFYLDIFHVL